MCEVHINMKIIPQFLNSGPFLICVCIYFFYCVSVIVFLDNELLIQASEVILA